jgi:UDP-N-acetylmuramoyl-L-alanyl-D-glutamate--2,6-diaminopimelate ligase
LQNCNPIKCIGQQDIIINSICLDSRTISANACYIAISGTLTDGHNFIESAIEKGATCIICNEIPKNVKDKITYVQVQNTQEIIGNIASNFYEHPSSKLKLIGITGTNGKTSVATLLYQLFTSLGYKCGLLSTVENIIGTQKIAATHTTPDAISLNKLLQQLVDVDCTHAFIEVSSHAIDQGRINGLQFAGGIFTNITHDHLDYHKTFDIYITAKKKFFDNLPKSAFALANIDDKRGMIMLQNTKAKKLVYALKNIADFKGKILEDNLTGLLVNINGLDVHCRMIGEFNAYNILAVYGAAIELGEAKDEILQTLSMLKGAEGRFDYIQSLHEKIIGIIDYAHTPDALLNVLATIQQLRKADQKILTLIGCGGNRDTSKRPLMAMVAAKHSDTVILTSDNPRNENAEDIITEMEVGIPAHQKKKCMRVTDRREAIKIICRMAKQSDIILIAGKGHEKYQEINGIKTPFDDKQILQETFQLLEK